MGVGDAELGGWSRWGGAGGREKWGKRKKKAKESGLQQRVSALPREKKALAWREGRAGV